MRFYPKAKAFIDFEGDLVILDESGECQHVCLTRDGIILYYNQQDAQQYLDEAKQIFYPGDTLTITL